MKHITFFLLILLINISLVIPKKSYANSEVTTKVKANSSIEEIREELRGMNIPVLSFTFEDNQFPSYEVIDHPEDCWGKSIINNEYVNGSLIITSGDEEIFNSGKFENKVSGVRVKYRGNTSTAQDYIVKKSFKIKLSKKADLLFRDEKKYMDKEWILLNGNKDIYNVIGSEVARICGMDWEPVGKPVCVIMNNQYMGYYYLVESVKASEARVNIQDSGFIIEDDAYWWKPDEVYFKTDNLLYSVGWTFKEPDPDDIDDIKFNQIKDLVQQFEDSLFNHENIDSMYDKENFASWLISHDILGTIDAGGSNIFLTKEDYNKEALFATKLKMGPLWDFDDCFKSDDESHSVIFSGRHFWYKQLLLYSDFYETLLEKWNEVKSVIINKLKPEIEKFLNDNPEIYKARLIDSKLKLLGRTPLSDPQDDYEVKLEWLENRLIALDNLFQNIPAAKIFITVPSIEIKEEETIQLETIVYPENASDTSIVWTSSNQDIVIVSESGVVTGISEGCATVTATLGNLYATCEVRVYKPIIKSESIILNLELAELNIGETIQLEASILPENTTDKTVIWKSSNNDVVTVNDYGLITAISEGDAVITAINGDISTSCSVTVKSPIIDAEQIILNLDSIELNVGETFQLEATVLPEDTTDKTVTWSSSDEGVVTVSESGLVTAISAGEIIITASCGEISATCEITVLEDSGVGSLLANPDFGIALYSIEGILIKKDCRVEDLKTLRKGIYIIVSGKEHYKISI